MILYVCSGQMAGDILNTMQIDFLNRVALWYNDGHWE